MGVLSKDDIGTNREFCIYYDAPSEKFTFYTFASINGGGEGQISATNFGAATVGDWNMVYAEYNGSTISISVNNSVPNTTSQTGVYNGTANLYIGRHAGEYLDGLIGGFKFFKRTLTNSEIRTYYNNGLGTR